MTSLKEVNPTDFQDLLTYIHTHYGIYGELPSEEKAVEFGIPRKLYQDAFKDEEFRAALEERGIILRRFEGDDWNSKGLTPLQLVAANQLLDLVDQRSTKKKLQDLQISTATYNAWLKDPAFSAYLKKRAEQTLGEYQHEAHLGLIYKLQSGDVKALQFYYEMMGIYVPQRAGVNQVDIHGLITKIIEIIDDELEDGDTKMIIGEKLKRLIAINNTASELVNSIDTSTPVGNPQLALPKHDNTIEIVPTRKIELKELDTDSLM